ncbi:MAG: signal recognition particle-docking protein FtsY [Cyanobacteria bacterium J06642_2]
MAFDWFRRSSDAAAAEAEAAREASPDNSTPEATEPAAEEPDYLAFAKAAYANLKAKQAEAAKQDAPAVESSVEDKPGDAAESSAATEPAAAEAAVITEEVERIAPPSAVAADREAAAEKVEETLDTSQLTVSEALDSEPASAPSVPELGESSPETPAAIAPEAAVLEPVSAPSPPAESDTVPAPAAAFFDVAPKAEARLEALEAMAIEAPVEPTTPAEPTVAEVTTAPAVPPALPDFPEFDDGFRWSAEILAAQGRRPEDVTVEEISWLQKLRFGLGKTRLRLVNQLKSLVGQGPIDAAAIEEIEAVLLQSDVGIAATDYIIEALQERVRDRSLPPEEAVAYLKELLREILSVGEPTFAPEQGALNIWLMVGVNGAGKTTTLGKLAHLANKSGYRTLVAAADTFRAAAVEQVQIWGDRAGVEVIANQGANTDPAAVVFDAISAARSRDTELLLVDTAGRLQNKKNLMDELGKIRRIVEKKAPEAQIESLLVLDATLGQNGMRQAEVFAEVANLSGVVLTKLDGTAKGGVALAVAKELQLPLRFIGVGEGIEDLRPFSSYEFVEALVSEY